MDRIVEQAGIAGVGRRLETRSLCQGEKLLGEMEGIRLEVPSPNACIHRRQQDAILGEGHRIVVGGAARQSVGDTVNGIDQLHPEFIQ